MSSILIKDMSMPETCDDCPFHVYHSHHEYVCKATPMLYPMNLANSKGIRKDWCPLVEVKTPHGRLIDEDEAKEHFYTCETNGRPLHVMELSERLACFDDVPTVIEAED